MAFKSKDGTRDFSMASRKRAYDMGHPIAQQEPTEAPADEEQDGDAIAESHGPAHEVTVTHDDEAGNHHVHSMHPDGHEHHSDHESRAKAHEHAAKVAGAGHDQENLEKMRDSQNQFIDEEEQEG